jgi:nucleoside-diphosphate-sugar epimerase
MPIIGSGANRIHWIHISDLTDALLLAENKGKPGEIYLVAGKEAKPQKDLFALLAKHLGVAMPQRHIPSYAASLMAYVELFMSKLKGCKPKLLPDHIRKITSNRIFDISKARQELGFEPKTDYDAAAKELVDEHMQLNAQ